jgi:hypothetical protein
MLYFSLHGTHRVLFGSGGFNPQLTHFPSFFNRARLTAAYPALVTYLSLTVCSVGSIGYYGRDFSAYLKKSPPHWRAFLMKEACVSRSAYERFDGSSRSHVHIGDGARDDEELSPILQVEPLPLGGIRWPMQNLASRWGLWLKPLPYRNKGVLV